MSGVGGVGGVGTQAQARQAMQPNSLDDFPALPRTQGNGDGIEDRGFISLTGLGSPTQFGVRQGSLSTARSGLVMSSGSQPSRLLDTVIQQTGNVQISDLEKKVAKTHVLFGQKGYVDNPLESNEDKSFLYGNQWNPGPTN